MNARSFQKGMTLIELMIAMVLGLVVVGGVISVADGQQEQLPHQRRPVADSGDARTAFELMARDIRQAGGSGCDNAQRMANVLTPGTAWWQNWSGIQGYDAADTDTGGGHVHGRRRARRRHRLDPDEGVDGGMLPIQFA